MTKCLTVCVTGGWAGAENAWEQEKLEAGKMLENSYSAHPSSARFVGRTACIGIAFLIIVLNQREVMSFREKNNLAEI
jgi:hypothetical protein